MFWQRWDTYVSKGALYFEPSMWILMMLGTQSLKRKAIWGEYSFVPVCWEPQQLKIKWWCQAWFFSQPTLDRQMVLNGTIGWTPNRYFKCRVLLAKKIFKKLPVACGEKPLLVISYLGIGACGAAGGEQFSESRPPLAEKHLQLLT